MAVRAALLIGCDWYSDPNLRRLRTPVSDIQALSRLLLHPDIGRFDSVELVPSGSRGAARADITTAIETFFQGRRWDDFLLLYFGGHGIQGANAELIFCARDTYLRTRNATGIPARWVSERIGESGSRRVVVLLDCCFSGAFPTGLLPRAHVEVRPLAAAEGKGRLVMTASNELEYAFEDERLIEQHPARSVFTHAVITGIETGVADRDGDGRISMTDLYTYVHSEVTAWSPQTPTLRGEQEGELFIAYRGSPPDVDMPGGLGLPRVSPPPRQRRPNPLEIVRTRVVRAPRLGHGIASATVRRWLCPVGQRVSGDTAVVEIAWEENGRLRTLEVPARVEGVLRGLTVVEGERIVAESALGVVAVGVGANGIVMPRQPRLAPRTGIVRLVAVTLPVFEPDEPATILAWWRAPGERTVVGEPLLQVWVGGSEVDVTSKVAGTLRTHALLVSETARGGEVVAVVAVD